MPCVPNQNHADQGWGAVLRTSTAKVTGLNAHPCASQLQVAPSLSPRPGLEEAHDARGGRHAGLVREAALPTLTALVPGRTVQRSVSLQRTALGLRSQRIQGLVLRVQLLSIVDLVKMTALQTSIVLDFGRSAQPSVRRLQIVPFRRLSCLLALVLFAQHEQIA